MELTNSVSIYVPSTIGENSIPHDDFIDITNDITHELTLEYGGTTVYPVQGTYKMNDGTVVRENLNVVEVFCSDSNYHKLVAHVKRIARDLCVSMEQESVSVKVGSSLVLVKKLPVVGEKVIFLGTNDNYIWTRDLTVGKEYDVIEEDIGESSNVIGIIDDVDAPILLYVEGRIDKTKSFQIKGEE